uniref:ATP synthase complex subunit 8 n=1 Tax=Epicauta obscurocephala TaxID=2895755 RepID=A0A9Y1LT87_9CUCU|nr:ATP synthase F0 subunit 8 [Epicauta obscurocephala]WET56770.1 ATP synthase F0 subunit 8 [Epicauta obscurocephala]
MPQMAPLNWLSLMIYFIAIFMLANSLNFYSFIYSPNKPLSLKSSTIKTNWKWL